MSLEPATRTSDPPSDGPASARPTWRRIALPAGAVVLGLAFVIGLAIVSGSDAGDAAQAPSSASPTAEPGQSSGETPTPAGTIAPTSSATAGVPLDAFGYNDILRVEVSGLAVRVAPYTHMPLATGYTLSGEPIGEVRLNPGDFVSVNLGPLTIGDTTWYQVFPAEGGQLNYSTVWWNTKPEVSGVHPGWVAAEVGGDIYLSLHEPFDPDPALYGLPFLPFLASGTGGYVSEPLGGFDYMGLEWVFVIDDQLAPCNFMVALETVDGGDRVVAVDNSTIGAMEAGGTTLGTANRTPVVGTDFEPFRVRVDSGCEWTFRLEALAHD